MKSPDSMTTDSYRAAKESGADPVIRRDNPRTEFQGSSRFGEWVREFRGHVADLEAGKGDNFPDLSFMRLSNDHTSGMSRNLPTPQFHVADNDYALGKLVEEVSKSPYWKDTAIFVVEDDAQDGPDHVDAHRSPALIISAWNREGVLVHEFHNTVSLIRTIEVCLGIKPMNFLDANAVPVDIFGATPNLAPYTAVLPDVAFDNLRVPMNPTNRAMLRYFELTEEQNLTRADMANPRILNEIIWFSVRGEQPMPGIARHAGFEIMTLGVREEDEEDEAEEEEE